MLTILRLLARLTVVGFARSNAELARLLLGDPWRW